ncbi:glycoside hydrolase family protein [Bradyrhizobium sp. SZCCHNRI2049]|uniref:glycoside hydrolase family protein n=1 Tax=Bradyrhizobium sp. SZCCHNRI2049 TaxID=3057287 RepID=UPI002916662B|nr:glycoside hydrolase family protein [Bradyrhizobium sp. SZCCHNRI2049]
MPLAFEDPYAGGTPDITLGNSRITPREAYSVDPHALNSRYADSMKNANQLFSALSEFAGAINSAGKEQEKKDADQAAVLAAQVGESIQNGENVDLKLGTLLPEHSPLARNAVAEILGKQRGTADAQSAYENMPLEARNDPVKAQAYFDQVVKESANQYKASPFYNNARTQAMMGVFRSAGSALSNQRNQQMVGIMQDDARKQFQSKADQIADDHGTGPRPLAAKVEPPGEQIGVPGTRYTIQSSVTPEGAALLRTITRSEANTRNPYGLIVGGQTFSNYGDHPRVVGVVTKNGPSTAAGAYQFTKTTWDEVVSRYGADFVKGPNGKVPFTPENQDRMAWYLAQDRYARLTGGRSLQTDLQSPVEHQRILNVLSNEWTSLPGGIEPNKATGGQLSTLGKELARAGAPLASAPNAPATTGSAPAPAAGPATASPDAAPAAAAATAAGASIEAQTALALAAATSKLKDYAGRPESLPPQVQQMRDALFDTDQMQNFTHPTVANAQKRDMMVDSVISTAMRTGDKEWLKAVPNSILTPDARDKLIKVEQQIDKNTFAAQEHARKVQAEARADAARDWNTRANAYIMQHPGEPPSAELVQQSFAIGDPDLLTGFNARRDAALKGLVNPKVEQRAAAALEDKMLAIAAAGGDPRGVSLNSILSPDVHQKLLDFSQTLAKNGGELSNDYYSKQWHSDAQSLYGFQFGVPIQGGGKGDPRQPEIDHAFQRALAEQIATYSAQHGAPTNDRQRLDIYQEALKQVTDQPAYKPTNIDGPRISGGQARPGDPEQDALKAAQEKYKLGR